MHTLIIFEEFPEKTRFALVPNSDLDYGDISVLRMAHNKYINSSGLTDKQDAAVNSVYAAMCPKEEWLPPEHPAGSKWAKRFARYIIPSEKPIEAVITRVVVCGWWL